MTDWETEPGNPLVDLESAAEQLRKAPPWRREPLLVKSERQIREFLARAVRQGWCSQDEAERDLRTFDLQVPIYGPHQPS